MNNRLKAAYLIVLLILVIVLAQGCATYQPMDKSTSIEDYCRGVYAESRRYQEGRKQGADRTAVAFYIATLVTNEHKARPEKREQTEREFTRMKWAADQIFLGRTPLDIERECITRRNDGTWF